MIPEADQKPDFLNRFDASVATRLYYLEPQVKDKKLRIHTVNTAAWKDGVKKQLASSWYDTVVVDSVLPTTPTDIKNGVLRVLLSVGNLTQKKDHDLNF